MSILKPLFIAREARRFSPTNWPILLNANCPFAPQKDEFSEPRDLSVLRAESGSECGSEFISSDPQRRKPADRKHAATVSRNHRLLTVDRSKTSTAWNIRCIRVQHSIRYWRSLILQTPVNCNCELLHTLWNVQPIQRTSVISIHCHYHL